MAEDVTAQQIADAIDKDYTQYRALGPIGEGSAIYYNAGDPVPASNVKLHKYDELGLVAKEGTKAAAAVSSPVSTEK